MRAIVTGAAGFIGSTLVDRLLAEGHQVIGIDNLSTGRFENLADASQHSASGRCRFAFIDVDIQAPELPAIVAGSHPSVIFHLAAQVNLRASVSNPAFDACSNVLGTISICEAAERAGVQRIVYAASGGSRYGAPEILPVDEAVLPHPMSPYAVSKLSGELYLGAYARMYGLRPIALALSNVYGPRQDPRGEAGVISLFGDALIAGRKATIFGDGSATRDYVYVDDVVDAFVRAGAAPASTTGTFNIGTGKQASVLEVHRLIADAVGGDSEPVFENARTGELDAIALDATRAGEELGWSAATELADGIGRTVHWLRTLGRPAATSGADA